MTHCFNICDKCTYKVYETLRDNMTLRYNIIKVCTLILIETWHYINYLLTYLNNHKNINKSNWTLDIRLKTNST